MPARGLGPPRAGLAACVLLVSAIVLADLLGSREKTQYVGLLVAVPFLAATFSMAPSSATRLTTATW